MVARPVMDSLKLGRSEFITTEPHPRGCAAFQRSSGGRAWLGNIIDAGKYEYGLKD